MVCDNLYHRCLSIGQIAKFLNAACHRPIRCSVQMINYCAVRYCLVYGMWHSVVLWKTWRMLSCQYIQWRQLGTAPAVVTVLAILQNEWADLELWSHNLMNLWIGDMHTSSFLYPCMRCMHNVYSSYSSRNSLPLSLKNTKKSNCLKPVLIIFLLLLKNALETCCVNVFSVPIHLHTGLLFWKH